MKKIYISPESLVVQLRCNALIATSLDKFESGADEGVVLTREEQHTFSNKSVWDNEW
ncbi:MAG: hypothetical protein J6W52_03360 [Bacteroidaceae bacterium]|nr:hypothetical protein [Bacteroidaceae bacterium]